MQEREGRRGREETLQTSEAKQGGKEAATAAGCRKGNMLPPHLTGLPSSLTCSLQPSLICGLSTPRGVAGALLPAELVFLFFSFWDRFLALLADLRWI